MIPKPCYAVLLLFPVKESTELYLEEERKRIEANGQILSEKVYFTKQIVGNACGITFIFKFIIISMIIIINIITIISMIIRHNSCIACCYELEK